MKQSNPLIWGAVGGLIAALLVTLALVFNVKTEPNPLLENPGIAGAGGFFWGWVAGSVKNWLARR